MRAVGEWREAMSALRRPLLALGAFSFCINLLLLMPAIYMLQVYDRVLTSRNEGTLLFLTILLVALLAVETALDMIRSRVLGRMGNWFDQRFDQRIFDTAFAHASDGRVDLPAQVFGDLSRLREFVAGKGLLALFDAPWAPLFLVVIFLLHPTLGLFALASMVVLVGIAWYNQRTTTPLMAEAGKLASGAQDEAVARMRNAEVIAALGMLGAFRDRWMHGQQQLLRVNTALADRAATIGGLGRYARMLLQSGILGLGAYLVLQGSLSSGSMIAASILLGRALSPVDLLISSWKSIAGAREARVRLIELLASRPLATPRLALPRPTGRITAEALMVAAPGRRDPILRNLNFEVAAGTLVGIVGPSGSGKSSLGRAVLGIWRPISGCVRLDGAAIHDRDRAEVGPWVGYLPQDVELFDGSIAENVARFTEIDSPKVVDAAKRAGVHDMVLRMPQGYETRIGPRGLVLSGGQRQRIGLARALYGNPALIVLDEPNSSLDEAGDAALLAALQACKAERRTTFVISHRMNVLEVVDRVMVLTAGQIKVFDARDEVLRVARAVRA